MYIICYYSEELKCNTWERVSGEDAMRVRVSELCGEGLDSGDILVFSEAGELDTPVHTNEVEQENDGEITHICSILDVSIALSGYKVMDGGRDGFVIRNAHTDRDFEIKITELVP